MIDYECLKAKISVAYTRLLKMHLSSNTGHIGGNISCIDALMTLHYLKMKPSDFFILSKGHAAGALYITLWSIGRLGDSDLDTFCQDGTLLAGHPSSTDIPGVLFSTGSLGHGPSLAAGLSLAEMYKKSCNSVFCLCSDGEWQEGSCWEALIFAVHHKLENLTILIDQNGLQGFGTTQSISSISDYEPLFLSFGASVISVDGHNPEEILYGINKRSSGKPLVVILKTQKGRGLDFENSLESHYLPITSSQYETACSKIRDEVVK